MSAPEKRSGHIAVKVRNQILVCCGHDENQHMEACEIWIYNVSTGRWKMRQACGQAPLLSGFSCALIDDILFCFGGFSPHYGHVNSIYTLDLSTLEWKSLLITSREPSPRDKLGCWVHEAKILFFGGYGPEPYPEEIKGGDFTPDESLLSRLGWNNDLLLFNTVACTWNALPHSVATPSPRAAHACACACKNGGYLFGGRHLDRRLCDLYSISLETYEWTKIIATGPIPEGRSWHTMTAFDKDHLFIFGGFNTQGDILGDAWIFYIKDISWEILQHECKEPKHWHAACLGNYYGQIVVFGGSHALENETCRVHSNDVRIFQLSPLPLKRIMLEAVVKFGSSKCGSWEHLPKVLKMEICDMLHGGA